MTETAAPYGGPRPEWVRAVIGDLSFAAEHLSQAQALMDKITGALAEHELPEAPAAIFAARHDAEHAWQHVTSTRRAIRMAWPREPGDDKEIAP